MQGRKPKIWIVTGASGRIGRMVVRRWQLQPPSGIVFVPQYRQPTADGIFWNTAAGAYQLEQWIGLNGPVDGLLVLGGVTPKPDANMQLNVDLVQAAIDAAKLAGIPRMLVASSSAVYGTGSAVAYNEAAPVNPDTAYAASKADAEEICRAYADPSLAITCLRIGNVAGADALLGANQAMPIKLDQFDNSDGPVRSYIGPETLADVLASLAYCKTPLPPVLNVAAPKPVTMQALLEAAQLPWQFVKAQTGAVQIVVLNTSLLCLLYNFKRNACEAGEIIRQWQSQKDAAHQGVV